jgi:hypothetical protein
MTHNFIVIVKNGGAKNGVILVIFGYGVISVSGTKNNQNDTKL